MMKILEKEGSIVLECRIMTKASRDEIRGVRADRLIIALTTPPIEGRANRALLKFLAKQLGIPSSTISIRKGERGRNKTLFIQCDKDTSIQKRLKDSIKDLVLK